MYMMNKFVKMTLCLALFGFLSGGCVEKELSPAAGEVRLSYDWAALAGEAAVPGDMVAYFYPEEGERKPLCFEGEQLQGPLSLARGNYRLLSFNRDVNRIYFTNLEDFDLANASLRPYGTKAGDDTYLPVADWLYGGMQGTLNVDAAGAQTSVIRMNPYVRRVRVVVETDPAVVKSSYGTLENTAIAVRLKDGKPAPMGNGTTRFEITRTEEGLLADFVIFGVDSSALSESGLDNKMNIVIEDTDGNMHGLEIDVTPEISGDGSTGNVEEEMVGIGKVTVSVGGWVDDGEDNTVTETPIRLAAYMGIAVRSSDRNFTGDYGVTVEKAGASQFVLYGNNKVSVDVLGESVLQTMMYYPLDRVNIYAYAPYAAAEPSTWTVRGDTLADDLLWARVKGQAETREEVPLRFSHLMSALSVELIRGENIPAADFEKTEVYFRNTVTSAKVDMRAGTVAVQDADAEDIRPQVNVAAGNSGMRTVALIVPQTVKAGEVLVYIKVAGRKDLVYMYKHSGDMVFTAGSRKVIRLTLNDAAPAVATKSAVREITGVVTEERF